MPKKSKPPKRASKFSSTAYTLKVCQDLGWLAGKTEYRLPFGRGGFGMTKDLFGFIDVLVVSSAGTGVIGLQVTSDACIMRRVHKIIDECPDAAFRFLNAQNIIEVWGYKRVMVGKQVRWDARRKSVQLTEDGLGLCSVDLEPLSKLKEYHANTSKSL